jgi:hypothetical protein
MASLFYLFCVAGHFPSPINTRGGGHWLGYVLYDKLGDRNNKKLYWPDKITPLWYFEVIVSEGM